MNNSMKAAVVIADQSDARPAISAAYDFRVSDVEVWVFGHLTEDIRRLPVGAILAIDVEGELVAERYMGALVQLANERGIDIFIFVGCRFADELAAQFACMENISCALAITGARTNEQGVAIIRRVYGMQLEAEIAFTSPPYVFSLAAECFSPVEGEGIPKIIKTTAKLAEVDWYIDSEFTGDRDEKNLDDYELVLVGGRGLGNTDGAQELERLAELLEAGVGGTRPAVWNGWLPYDRMVGLSGTVIKPKLCITFGVSGSTPFTKGVEMSNVLVAVNNDPDALIFRHCDIGILDDVKAVMSALIRLAEEK